MRILVLTAATLCTVAAGAAPVLAQQTPVLHVRTAIVAEDFSVRPMPQVALLVIGPRGDTTRLETDLSGVADLPLTPGAYRVESARPIDFAGAQLAWRVPVSVTAQGGRAELTNRNATAPDGSPLAATSTRAPTARRVSEEAVVFERVKSGVFTVYGEEGKGSGFLVDPAGLVLTNAHVVNGSREVRVQLDAATKVRARLVHVDRDRDVAVLAIPMARCGACAVLPLASGTPAEIALPGERVLAIGSPLNQTSVLTLGIVSRVEARAILSDVNINHGNSGGPLLNGEGKVIAINTFGDFTTQGGPGISGSVLITQATPALEAARAQVASGASPAPADSLLPVAPADPFPLDVLKAVGQQARYDMRPYAGSGGAFDFVVLTPPSMAWREAQVANAVLQRRRGREARAGVTDNERVDPIQNWPSWTEYVGDRKAVVVFNIVPKVGETRGSFWGNMLGAVLAGPYYQPHTVLEFKGDFREMTLLRDSAEVVPVERGRVPAVLNIEDYRVRGKDYAFQGFYVYRPDDFAPRADGTFAAFTLRIDDTAHPGQRVEVRVPPRTVEAIWKDFEAYRRGASSPSAAR